MSKAQRKCSLTCRLAIQTWRRLKLVKANWIHSLKSVTVSAFHFKNNFCHLLKFSFYFQQLSNIPETSNSEDMQEFLALNSVCTYFGKKPFVKSRIDKVRNTIHYVDDY